ncbi:Nectin-2 Herpes virus entry mediator B [Takifugu flavidus]|uniref:Nectin-2 Herpes virus entry mediator B n=1 Tax=Takifugu flavidus TaxID=433684 RepID=A0A5C6PPS7_9TELE|nr:Nectin-2 Herpes virus entry mediator B [Takifugu flavidus]
MLQVLRGLAPSYLEELVTPYQPNRPLRSQNAGPLVVPRVSRAPSVVGRDVSVIQGETGVLLCSVIDTNDSVSQISWEKHTRGHPQNSEFVTITPGSGLKVINGDSDRVKFIGNIDDKNGSLELSGITLMDEGIYTCAFTLYPGGIPEKTISLNVFGNLTTIRNAIEHHNGTVTTVSSLVGVPSRELDQQLVQCVVTSKATKDQTLPFTIQIYFPPSEVNINEQLDGSFSCDTAAKPKPEIVWTRIDGSWPESSVTVKDGRLKFLTMDASLNGLYQCEASNEYGSKYGRLYVHNKAAYHYSGAGKQSKQWPALQREPLEKFQQE